jgi:prepilin-type N-terminal cleavage/methylation domain-containing protein
VTGNRTERGLTLLEVVLAAGILAIVVSLAYPALDSGIDAYGVGATAERLERTANRVVDEIARRLARSSPGAVSPLSGSTPGLQFQETTGFESGAATWGPTHTLELRAEDGDPWDGVDNDGDGLVDEGVVVLRLAEGTPDEQEVRLATSVRRLLEGETANGLDDNGNGLVDEPGLALSETDGLWTIRLTLERPTGTGAVLTRTVSTSVRPRSR